MSKVTFVDWSSEVAKEFNSESDRALVILASAMLEQELERLLRTSLVAVLTSDDSLFDGPNAPMGSFSSSIDFAYRLGLISDRMRRDLNIIRKIRNDFAHNVTGCTFQNQAVKNRIAELRRSFSSFFNDPLSKPFSDTERKVFQLIAGFIVHYLYDLAQNAVTKNQHSLEWLYKSTMKKIMKPKDKQKNK